ETRKFRITYEISEWIPSNNDDIDRVSGSVSGSVLSLFLSSPTVTHLVSFYMLSQLPILLLSLAASVAALSVPQIHGRGGAVNRAVELSTFLPENNTTGVPTAIEAEPTTARAPITTKVLDNLPSFLTGTQIGQGTFYAS
ncbi:hypothetical protein E4T56_gene9005, partial [Termitomyces sp. T112]